jgi:murein DD-endopeptidase
MVHLRKLGFLFSLVASGAIASVSAQTPRVRTSIGHQPALDHANGKVILRYELLVTNDLAEPVTLTRLEVSDKNNRISLAAFGPAQLANMGKTSLVNSESGIIYLDIDMKPRHPLQQIINVMTFTSARDVRTIATIESSLDNRSPVKLGPPLGLGYWVAVHSDKWPRGHRRMPYSVNSVQRIPGRFAVDFVGVDRAGRISTGDPDNPAAAVGYSAPVLAVADAVVADVHNDIKEAKSISVNGAHGPAATAGNFVILDLGENRFAFYEHLKPESVVVAPGDKVRRGQIIGKLGFTGDSTGPHLHFHVADRPSSLGAEGLPFVIEHYHRCGSYLHIDNVGQEKWTVTSAQRVTDSRPAGGDVVSFTGRVRCKQRL